MSGHNADDSGSSSNGAGKTSLISAPLWALTGSLMARTEVRQWDAQDDWRGECWLGERALGEMVIERVEQGVLSAQR